MELKNTLISNIKLVLDESGTPIAVLKNGKIEFRLHDKVTVNCDSRGYICPTIKKTGMGQITKIDPEASTDRFYGVQTENGEFGFVKSDRLEKAQ